MITIPLTKEEKILIQQSINFSSKEWPVKCIFNRDNYMLYTLTIQDLDMLINIKEACLTYLLYIGYDKEYEINEQGLLLDRIIEKLEPFISEFTNV